MNPSKWCTGAILTNNYAVGGVIVSEALREDSHMRPLWGNPARRLAEPTGGGPEWAEQEPAGKPARVGAERGLYSMTFSIGETVVYPNHGTAVIEDIENRTIKGEERLYLVLRIIGQNDLVVRVPACNLDLVGVRDVVDQDGLERVFDILRAEHTEEPSNWSRRFKANMEKLHSGNVIKVAEVVRDLWRRDRDKGLSAGEKRMLTKARGILVAEMALAEKVDDARAEQLLDEVLAS